MIMIYMYNDDSNNNHIYTKVCVRDTDSKIDRALRKTRSRCPQERYTWGFLKKIKKIKIIEREAHAERKQGEK